MLKSFVQVVQYESSKMTNYKYSDIKLVSKKLVKESKKLEQNKFVKIYDKIYDYKHSTEKVSGIDLNKEWCTCNTMFDEGLCSHLVKRALDEDYQLPGMAPKPKSLIVRRSIQAKNLNESFSLSESELADQLERLEYTGTQLESVYMLSTNHSEVI